MQCTDGTRTVCAIGALDEQCRDYVSVSRAVDALVRATGWKSIAAWNDEPWLTAESVALAFDLAATLVESPLVPVEPLPTATVA